MKHPNTLKNTGYSSLIEIEHLSFPAVYRNFARLDCVKYAGMVAPEFHGLQCHAPGVSEHPERSDFHPLPGSISEKFFLSLFSTV